LKSDAVLTLDEQRQFDNLKKQQERFREDGDVKKQEIQQRLDRLDEDYKVKRERTERDLEIEERNLSKIL